MGLSIYLNGTWATRREDAVVPLYDHGFLYGDGIFEGIRGYAGRVFRLEEHLRRLYDSARGIHLEIPVTRSRMKDLVVEACRRSGDSDLYIRLIISRGPGDLGIDPRKCTEGAGIYIIAGAIQLYSPQKYEEGLKVVTVSTRRNRTDALPAQIKSLNYLNNIFGKMEANRLGADEGLMLDGCGYVTEATADNIFMVRDGVLSTPAAHFGLLAGITRQVVLDLAGAMGIATREVGMLVQDLICADELFLTGTGAELIPVVNLDGEIIADGRPGPVFRKLLAAFSSLTRTEGEPFLEKVGETSDG
ncbi:MAG: branched-chain-amino-acid transaminase [Acidobacteria bacterium]|nr:branched-chain-amino-acid transaminase [Acidobacteriota bacterium]